jgi:hypothetical protein
MNPTQSNTQRGRIVRIAGADLTSKEGYLCRLTNNGGVPAVNLPAAITDVPTYIVDDGGIAGAEISIDPLTSERQFRIPLKGACDPGDALVLAAIAGADPGKLRKLPTATGTYRVIFRAEEKGVDGQLVLCRPSPEGNVIVP